MKTIEEIINRNDYVRLNKSLTNRVEEIATLIADKMEELDMAFHQDHWHKVGDCVFSCMLDRDDHPHIYLPNDERGYWDNVEYSSSDKKVIFLNHARRIFEWLSSKEDELCKSINAAIEQTNDLVK